MKRFFLPMLLCLSTFVVSAQIPALTLERSHSYATIDPPIVLSPPYTIAFWFQSYRAGDNVLRALLGFTTDTGTVEALTVSDGRQLRMDPIGLRSRAYAFTKSWHYVAVVVRSDHAVLYINGQLRGNRTGQFSDFRINEIGRYLFAGGSDTTYFHGAIAQLRIWKNVQSESAIRATMHLSVVSGAYASFNFQNRQDSIVYDHRGDHRCILRNGAAIQEHNVPVANFLLETAAAWKYHPRAQSGGMELRTTFDDATAYLIIGHSDAGYSFESVNARGIVSQTKRYWGVVGSNVRHPITVVAHLFSYWPSQKLAFLLDTTAAFRNPAVVLGKLNVQQRTLTLPYLPMLADTVYFRLVQLPYPVAQIAVTSSQGFGPFMQGYRTYTTFRIDSLPSAVSNITFALKADTTVRARQEGAQTVWKNVDVGQLPVNGYLYVRLAGDTTLPVGGYRIFRSIAMSIPKPIIRSSFGFLPFFASLDTMVRFTVTHLPPRTTEVTIKFAHSSGRTVTYIDSAGNRHIDSVRFSGHYLDSVEYTVALGKLQLPLSPLLVVTVHHEDGYPGGTNYTVGMDLIADSVQLLSEHGFGPFVTKAAPVRCRQGGCPPDLANVFRVQRLPRYTSKVRFEIVDRAGNVLDSSVHHITEQLRVLEERTVQSKPFHLSEFSLQVAAIRARVWASGSADTGIVRSRALQIVAPAPQVVSVLSAAQRPLVARNPFDTADQHTTYDTLRIIPSIRGEDTLRFQIAFLDTTQAVLADTVILSPPESDTIRYRYDAAALSPACKQIQVLQTPVRDTPWVSEPAVIAIQILPGKPVVKTPLPLDSLLSGQMWEMPVHITGIPVPVTKMIVTLEGDEQSPVDQGWNMHGGGNFDFSPGDGPHSFREFTLSFWMRLSENPQRTVAIAYAGGSNHRDTLWDVVVSSTVLHPLVVNVTFRMAIYQRGQKKYAYVTQQFYNAPDFVTPGWHRVVFVARHQGSTLQLFGALDGQSIYTQGAAATYRDAQPYQLNQFFTPHLFFFPSDLPGNFAEMAIFYKVLPGELIHRLPQMNFYHPIVRRHLIEDYHLTHYFPLNFHQNDEVPHRYGGSPYSNRKQQDFRASIVQVRGVPGRQYRPRWSDTLTRPSIPYAHFVRTDSATALTLYAAGTYGKYTAPHNFTLLFWMRTTSNRGGKILGFENMAAPALGSAYDRHIYMSTDGRLHFGLWSSDKHTQVLSTQYPYNDGQWHHIAVTFEQTGTASGKMRLYVDGVSIDEKDGVSFRGSEYLGYWRFGNGSLYPWPEAPQQDRCLTGYFTEISVYATALSGAEIAALMHRPPLLDYSGLQHYLPLSDTSVATVADVKTGRALSAQAGSIHKIAHIRSIHEAILYRNFGMLVPDAQHSVARYSLNVQLFYPGGPEAGVTYRYPVVVHAPVRMEANEERNIPYPIAVFAEDGGFGPFFEADRDSVRIRVRGLWGRDAAPATLSLRKRNGEVLEQVAFADDWTALDIGEAEPGAFLTFELQFTGFDDLKMYDRYHVYRYPLKVRPLIPPRISGDFGPFLQAIADGAMEQNTTLEIIEYADEVRMIADYYDHLGNFLRSDTARKVPGNDSLWRLTTPMGELSPPNTTFVLNTYDAASGDLLRSYKRVIKIVRTRPDWLMGATFSNVREDSAGVSFIASLPYNAPLPRTNWLPLDILVESQVLLFVPVIFPFPPMPLFANATVAFPQNSVTIHCWYDKATQQLTISEAPVSHMEVKVFGIPIRKSFPWTRNDQSSGNFFTLTSHNALRARQMHSFIFQQDLPTIRAVASFLRVIRVLKKAEEDTPFYVTVGFNLAFGQYLHHHYDTLNGHNGSVGTIGYPEDSARLPEAASFEILQLGGGLTLSVGFSIADGLAGMSLDFTGRLLFGLGHQWADLPVQKVTTPQHSIALQIYGKVVLHYLFIGWKTIFGPKMIYHHQFGEHFPELFPSQGQGIFGMLKSRIFGKAAGEAAELSLSNPSMTEGENDPGRYANLLAPEKFPQPAVAAKDSLLMVLWIEESDDDLRRLLISHRSFNAGKFTAPVTLIANRNAPVYPELCYAGGDYAVAVWMQSRYTPETVPYPLDPVDFLRSEDIWYAVYNVRTRSVEAIGMIPDAVDSTTNGRVEGKPVVAALDTNRFLIVWHFFDGDRSDLLSVELGKHNGLWSVAMPPILLHSEFSDYELALKPLGTEAAVLTSIERGYSSERQPVTRLTTRMYQNGWSEVSTVFSSSYSGEHIVAMDHTFRQGKGVLLLLSTDTVQKQSVVRLYLWDSTGQAWDPMPVYEWRDSIALLTQPRVAINANNIAAATFRRTSTARIFGDYQSQIDLIAVDLERRKVALYAASPYVCDTTAQVYAYDLEFARNAVLNIFLHEQRAVQGRDTVYNGIIWGNPDMKLVLRAVQLDTILQLQDIPEDTLVVTSIPKPKQLPEEEAQIQLYPSPATDAITLRIRVSHPAPVEVVLYTGTGEKLASVFSTPLLSGEQAVHIPLQRFSSGIYHCVIQIGNRRYQRQFLILR